MQSRHIHALVGAFLCACGVCQASPQATWLETKHNFGAFHEDEGTVECVFRYVNTGDTDLCITAARTSCGCTIPHYSREAVAPGDTASVTVSYDPTGRPGRFSKNVYIDMNTEPVRTTLAISGVVIGAPVTLGQRYPVETGTDLRLSRGAVMAGDVKAAHTKSVFVEAYNASTDTLRPEIVRSPRFVKAVWMPEAVAPGEQTSLVCHVSAADTGTWGLVADSIEIRPTSGAPEAFTLPVTVVVTEDFSRLTDEQRAKAPVVEAAADRLDFGVVERTGGVLERTVELTNAGRTPLEIRRVYTLDDGVDATASRTRLKPGKSAVITVRVDPSELRGSLLNSKINVITNDPSRPNLTLRAVGQLH